MVWQKEEHGEIMGGWGAHPSLQVVSTSAPQQSSSNWNDPVPSLSMHADGSQACARGLGEPLGEGDAGGGDFDGDGDGVFWRLSLYVFMKFHACQNGLNTNFTFCVCVSFLCLHVLGRKRAQPTTIHCAADHAFWKSKIKVL